MDPLRLAIAAVPVAAYLMVLGVVNLRRRPLMTSGGADLAAVLLAVSGLAFVGPIELFRPEPATTDLGDAMWLLLIGLYGLTAMLAVLTCRPRLVLYNLTAEQLRPLLADAVAELDADARWAGDGLVLPSLGVQLHLDVFGPTRTVSLVSSGATQDLEGWRRLRRSLDRAIGAARVAPNPRAYGMLLASAVLLLAGVAGLAASPLEVAQAIDEIFAF